MVAGPGSPGPGVGGWRLGPPRAELHRRGGERGAAGGRGDCCYGLVISAAPARVSPGPGGCSSPSTLSRGHGLVCGRGSCGGGGRGLGAVAFGEGGDHLPARRADPGHRPGRAAQRDPRGPGGRRHRLGGERGRSLASASRLVRPPRIPGVGPSHLCLTPSPRPPEGCPGRCVGAGRTGGGPWSQVRSPPASLPPPGLKSAGDCICGFILSVPTPGILLDYHPARPSRPGRATVASQALQTLSPLPHGPPGLTSRAHPGCLALGTF